MSGSGGRTENLFLKTFKITRELGDSEVETDDGPKEPDIGRVVEPIFNQSKEYSRSKILTDIDLIPMDRSFATAITSEMRLRTALAADFRRKYKKNRVLWKQRPGKGGLGSFATAA